MTPLPKVFYGKASSLGRSQSLSLSSMRSRMSGTFHRLNFIPAIPQHYEPATFWRLKTGYYQRSSSDYSLSEAFGKNATQDSNVLVIQKADLELLENCSPEQLLMTLIQRWVNLSEDKKSKRIRAFLWKYEMLLNYERHVFAIQILIPSTGEVVGFSFQTISI